MSIEAIVAIVGAVHLMLTSAVLLFVRDVRNTIHLALSQERDHMKTWVHENYIPRDPPIVRARAATDYQ